MPRLSYDRNNNMSTERSITKDVQGPNNDEVLSTFITGREDLRRVVTQIWAQAVTNDQDVRGYVDQDRVVDVAGESEQLGQYPIPVNVELDDGQSFKAGWIDRSGSAVLAKITVFYTEDSKI